MAIYKGREVNIDGLLPDPGRRVKITHVGTQEVEIVDFNSLSLTEDEKNELQEQHVAEFNMVNENTVTPDNVKVTGEGRIEHVQKEDQQKDQEPQRPSSLAEDRARLAQETAEVTPQANTSVVNPKANTPEVTKNQKK